MSLKTIIFRGHVSVFVTCDTLTIKRTTKEGKYNAYHTGKKQKWFVLDKIGNDGVIEEFYIHTCKGFRKKSGVTPNFKQRNNIKVLIE